MKRNEKTYIYVLRCPKTDVVKYVGKTIDIKYRYRKHLTEKHKNKKCFWVQSLLSQGLKPKIEVIDEVAPNGDWESVERYWIKYYRSIGQAFCNQTDGGESGSQKGIPISKEHKEAISKANKGRKRPDNKIRNKRNKGNLVGKYDKDWNLIQVYHGTKEAAESINRSTRRLQAMCKHGHMNGKTINHVGGYKWKYIYEANKKTN